VYAKVAISNPTNYIFLRSAINTLSIDLIKSPYFKNQAGMPTNSDPSSSGKIEAGFWEILFNGPRLLLRHYDQ